MTEQVLPLAGATSNGEWILVSPEMTAVIGAVPAGAYPLPPEPVSLVFDLKGGTRASVTIGDSVETLDGSSVVGFFVARAAWKRLGGGASGRFHMSNELRGIAVALRDCRMSAEPRTVYRLGKSIELLCETIAGQREGKLLPFAAEGALSIGDTRRLLVARRMVDERWSEKLTLEAIARACGLNREKLTRGFREMFDCSIGEALAERRLGHASKMLLTTDKPVSSIGYENGYLSNASFARAFSRRFGVSPSDYRSCGVMS